MLVVKPDPENEYNELKVLNCTNDGESVGSVTFRQKGYILDVVDISPNPMDPGEIKGETYAVLDTVIRALGSYGLNHSCFYLESESGSIYPTLEKLRFQFQEGKMKSTLQKLLVHCNN